MQRVINGKRYDSKTAVRIGYWNNNYQCNDFHFCEEELFVTKNGNFFIVGEGGALSKYGEYHGDSRTYGSSLITATKSEARTWCEEHDVETEIMEKYFTLEDA